MKPTLLLMCAIAFGAMTSIASSQTAAPPTKADLIFTHGNVYTGAVGVGSLGSTSRAEAIAVRGDRILAVGSRDEIARLKGPHVGCRRDGCAIGRNRGDGSRAGFLSGPEHRGTIALNVLKIRLPHQVCPANQSREAKSCGRNFKKTPPANQSLRPDRQLSYAFRLTTMAQLRVRVDCSKG